MALPESAGFAAAEGPPATGEKLVFGADIHGLLITAVLDDLEGHIHLAGEDGSVADAHDRRRIEEDKIVALLQFADQIFHLRRAKDAQGAAGELAAGHEIHGWNGA